MMTMGISKTHFKEVNIESTTTVWTIQSKHEKIETKVILTDERSHEGLIISLIIYSCLWKINKKCIVCIIMN